MRHPTAPVKHGGDDTNSSGGDSGQDDSNPSGGCGDGDGCGRQ
ncbi:MULTISPECIES: hypothetical protein [unclassified Streptomyces]